MSYGYDFRKNVKTYEYLGSQEEFYELVEEIKNVEGFLDASYSEKTFLVEDRIDVFPLISEQFHKDLYQLID